MLKKNSGSKTIHIHFSDLKNQLSISPVSSENPVTLELPIWMSWTYGKRYSDMGTIIR